MSEQNKMRSNNIGTNERIVSALGGSYLLYNAFTGKRGGLLKGLTGSFLLYRGVTGYCPITEAIEKQAKDEKGTDVDIHTTLLVNKPVDEVYDFWRKLENLPKFMDHLKKVEEFDGKISEWEAKIPGDIATINWKSKIIDEDENNYINWESLPGSQIENRGMVRFSDAGNKGTKLEVEISYRAPMGSAGKGVSKLLNPIFEDLIREDIKNFKRYMETGEVATTEGQPSGAKRH
jgi:uncharacterized membrane protein